MYEAKYQRKWLKKNPEYMKEWREKNKEKILEYHKQWAKEHPGYMYEHIQASRKKKPEYYKEQKRLYARKVYAKNKLEKKVEIEVEEMKFRNRGKHNFKRIKRQMKVYDYCLENISNHITFTVDDIAKDLQIPRSTLVELLNELTDTGKLYYQRGYIEIKNIGNNGCNPKIVNDREGLKVKRLPRNTQTKLQKQNDVYSYLCELTNKGVQIPCLTDLYKMKFENQMHITTLMEILKQLDRDDKIIYKKGKILAVYIKDLSKEKDTGKTLKYNNGSNDIIYYEEPITESVEQLDDIKIPNDRYKYVPIKPMEDQMSDVQLDLTEKYDKAVKELIAEYIMNANITTRDEIMEYVDAILKITDKLRNKLF